MSNRTITTEKFQLNDVRGEIANLTEQIQRILSLASKVGADSAEMSASISTGFEVTARKGDLELAQFGQDQALQVTLYQGRSSGSASTTGFSPEALDAAVVAAWHIATHSMPDDAAGLADAKDLISAVPDLDLYHPWVLLPEAAQNMALATEAAACLVDSRINNSSGASVSTTGTLSMYGNSHGFIGEVVGSRHSISCAMIASENGEMQQDYWYSVARDSSSLEDTKDVGRIAGERTVARLGGAPISTGPRSVLLAAPVASGFFGHLIAAMSGSALYHKASFLLDRIGEQILPSGYNVYEQPLLLGGLYSSPFDGDGLATREQNFVEAGRLASYVLSTYSARRLGLRSTANAGGIHNLGITNDGLSFDELLAEMGDGLYITELMGPGVNIVTGDYSRGASGFLVEGGRITQPVQSVTIAGKLADLFMNIRAIGTDTETRSRIRSGSVLLDGFTVAGA